MVSAAGIRAAFCLAAAAAVWRQADSSCVLPSAAEPSSPSPALAVCSAYRDMACCTLDTELEFMAAISQAGYAAASCRSLMMDLHCGVLGHPNQSSFVNETAGTVRICSSFCDSLYAACGGDEASAAAWCGAQPVQWRSLGYNTTVVADGDAPGSCWGANDGCDGIPNSRAALDRCGVCGGDATSCVVPGAARSAAIRAVLDTELAAHSAASAAELAGLAAFTTSLEARLASEQSRAAASWNETLLATQVSKASNLAKVGADSAATVAAAAGVDAALGAAKQLSENTLDVLAADVAAGTAAVRADYSRAGTSHGMHSALHTALLEREMAEWQTSQDEVLGTIERLKSQ
eukprot:SAG22_NODE_20_length_32168_cov_40.859241_14_plen_348_part_00